MTGRLTGLRGQVSSRWLASVWAVAYLLASAALGVLLLTGPHPAASGTVPAVSAPVHEIYHGPSDAAQSQPPNRSDDSGTAETVTAIPDAASTAGLPPGFERVTGPAGMRTVIPAGWSPKPTTGPGAAQATDPVNAGRFVKYGGSFAPQVPIGPAHIQYENGFAGRTANYRRILLLSATYGGHEAVEWEFEHLGGTGLAHVRSLYWRVNGTEYFLLASAPSKLWAQMKPVYDNMVANAEP